MAESDPRVAQAVDPEVTADLTRLLRIRGPLGILNVLDTIVPVVSLGDVVTRTVTILQPSFRSTDIFSAGIQTAAAINTIHADTGALAAGIYDVQIHIGPGDESTFPSQFAIEHRNATNTATLAIWDSIESSVSPRAGYNQSLAYELSLNERLRILNLIAFSLTVSSYASIFARIR